MATPPPDAKEMNKCLNYGIDENGDYVFFGFEFADGSRTNIIANHYRLGNAVNYLDAIAREAQRRHQSVDPNNADKEARGRQYNPVRKIDFDVDLTGDSAAMLCITHSGARHELQLDLTLMEGLLGGLPSLIEEMKRRKAESKKQH